MDWQVFNRSRRRHGWAVLGFALLLLLAGPRPLLAEDGLAGQLLVAAPEMSDPNFSHTVIYILRHDPTGALGLVINRPMGEVPLDRLLALLEGTNGGETSPDNGNGGEPGDPLLVFSGGPVDPYRAFTLHSRDVMPEHSVPVDDDTAFNVEDEVLKALAEDAAPKSLLFVLGYSGWAAGQLESELDRGDWYVVASDPSLLFSAEPARTWERAVALFGTEL
ncbi:MAG TPA: YqgE/AlgH family protein [Kiloniellales bacterium]